MASFITVDRKILKWEWYQDVKVFHLFLYFLLRANWEDGSWQGKKIKRGQLITGRLQLSRDTGLTEREVRTCQDKLKMTGEIEVKATSKYSIITICKYDVYQNKYDKSDQQNVTRKTNKTPDERPVKDNQTTTNNKNKEEEHFKEEFKSAENLNGHACYNAETYILENQQVLERVCMATYKKTDEVKKELHLYHLWLAKNEKYPMGKAAAEAGIESWILNAVNFKKSYNGTDKSSIKHSSKSAGAYELLDRLKGQTNS